MKRVEEERRGEAGSSCGVDTVRRPKLACMEYKQQHGNRQCLEAEEEHGPKRCKP